MRLLYKTFDTQSLQETTVSINATISTGNKSDSVPVSISSSRDWNSVGCSYGDPV